MAKGGREGARVWGDGGKGRVREEERPLAGISLDFYST
jgi:hypothetical protein